MNIKYVIPRIDLDEYEGIDEYNNIHKVNVNIKQNFNKNILKLIILKKDKKN
jgi:hypothetical protein